MLRGSFRDSAAALPTLYESGRAFAASLGPCPSPIDCEMGAVAYRQSAAGPTAQRYHRYQFTIPKRVNQT